MPQMLYKAMDERGRIVNGRVDAVNIGDLEMRLRRMGLDLISSREANVRGPGGGGKVRRQELIGFCFHLEQLLASGVPVLDGLADLRDSVDDPKMREVIAGMVESIEGGKTLSGAMEEYPAVFGNVFINLVRAGELSGSVSEVLRSITQNLKWEDEQIALIKRLMTYPIIVGTVVIGVVMFLMGYLVPQLVSFIKSMGQELPFHTIVLIWVSNVVANYWYLVIAAPFAATAALMASMRLSPAVAYGVDEIKLKLWVFGPLYKKIILARFASYFALMYASGITVLECIRVCEGLVGNRVVEEATRRAGRQIADGASISAGFESTAMFPPLVLRMLRVGENTGGLDTALLNISYFYDRDVKESMQRLETMIGPAMTLILGGILFWVIFSVLGPIYDLITKVQV